MPFRSCKLLKCGTQLCRQLKPAKWNLCPATAWVRSYKDVHLPETLINNFLQAPVWVFNPFLLYCAIMLGIVSKKERVILSVSVITKELSKRFVDKDVACGRCH